MSRAKPMEFVLGEDDYTGCDALTASDPRVEVHALIGSGERIGAYLGDGNAWADADNAGRADAFGEQEVAYIGNITVTEAFRGQGLGHKALVDLLAWLDSKNVAASFLYAMPMGRRGLDWSDLKAWYARHGFHVVSREGYGATGYPSNAMMRVHPRANRKRKRSRK